MNIISLIVQALLSSFLGWVSDELAEARARDTARAEGRQEAADDQRRAGEAADAAVGAVADKPPMLDDLWSRLDAGTA